MTTPVSWDLTGLIKGYASEFANKSTDGRETWVGMTPAERVKVVRDMRKQLELLEIEIRWDAAEAADKADRHLIELEKLA